MHQTVAYSPKFKEIPNNSVVTSNFLSGVGLWLGFILLASRHFVAKQTFT